MKHLLYLLSLLFLFGCASVPSPDNQETIESTVVPNEAELPGQDIRFLALGDSYTIGQGVSEDKRWPVQLAARLEEQNTNAQVTILARTGWTTENLLFNLATKPPEGTFDLVSVLIGVNDQFRGGEPEAYRIRFRELLEQAIVFAGNDPQNVIVLSIPDWEVTPFAERLARPSSMFDIDDFNEVNLQEAQAFGVYYVDITPISRRVTRDDSLLAPDGLHPSGTMYDLWVEVMLPQIVEIIR